MTGTEIQRSFHSGASRARDAGMGRGEPHHNLVAWLARMQARPRLQATTWQRVAEMAKAA